MPILADPGRSLSQGVNTGLGIIQNVDEGKRAEAAGKRQAGLDKEKSLRADVAILRNTLNDKNISSAAKTDLYNGQYRDKVREVTGVDLPFTPDANKVFLKQMDRITDVMQGMKDGTISKEAGRAEVENIELVLSTEPTTATAFKTNSERSAAKKERELEESNRGAKARAFEINSILDSGKDENGNKLTREKVVALNKERLMLSKDKRTNRGAIEGTKDFTNQKKALRADEPKSTDALLVQMSGEISGRTGQPRNEVLAELKKPFAKMKVPTKIEVVALSLGLDIHNLDEDGAELVLQKLSEMSKASLGSFAEKLKTHMDQPKNKEKTWLSAKAFIDKALSVLPGGKTEVPQVPDQVPDEINNEAQQLFE